MLGFASISELAIGEAAESGNAVSGWKTTSFGTPSVTLKVQGLQPARFGVAAVAVSQLVDASGFKPVHFGVATVNGIFHVSGFSTVRFGEPSLLPHAVGFSPVRFGSVSLALNVGPLQPVIFGAATAAQRNRVTTLQPLRIGTPTVPTSRTRACSGFMPVRFGYLTCYAVVGIPRRQHGHVYPVHPVHFGTPTI